MFGTTMLETDSPRLNVVELLLVWVGVLMAGLISLVIFHPFSGSLTRLRANYLPKAIQLDLQDGNGPANRNQSAKIGPVVSGIWKMLFRTKKLSGWSGVYQGAAPSLVQILLLSIVGTSLVHINGPGGMTGMYGDDSLRTWSFWANLLLMLFSTLAVLPLNVITTRCIVHPRSLPYNNPRKNLRELLSHSEFRQPWRLYFLPGLLSVTFAQVVWSGAGQIIRQLLIPSLVQITVGPGVGAGVGPPGEGIGSGEGDADHPTPTFNFSFLGLSVFIAWLILSVIVLVPLQCATIRLSIQKPERQEALPTEARPVGEDSQRTSQEANILGSSLEPVIAPRNCDKPRSEEEAARLEADGFGAPVAERYTGLADCLKKMVEEEGGESLRRAAWVTVLGVLGGSLA